MGGLEFTPMGIVPMGQGQAVFDRMTSEQAPTISGPVVPAAPIHETARAVPEAAAQIAVTNAKPARLAPATLKPREFIRAARAQLRDLEREIRRLKSLERDRDELRRLLAAANKKPTADVRVLPRAAR